MSFNNFKIKISKKIMYNNKMNKLKNLQNIFKTLIKKMFKI